MKLIGMSYIYCFLTSLVEREADPLERSSSDSKRSRERRREMPNKLKRHEQRLMRNIPPKEGRCIKMKVSEVDQLVEEIC
jgi:hypothetical protein